VKAIETPPKGESAMSTFSMLKFRAAIFAAALAFAPLASALHAQDAGMMGRMNVPFAFEMGSQHYPAGVYTIRMENEHAILIRGTSVSGLALALVESNDSPAKHGQAVFHRYGDRYFLNAISITGKGRCVFLRQSKEEGNLQIAAGKTRPANLEIALSTPR
jgi:hypothetical protein